MYGLSSLLYGNLSQQQSNKIMSTKKLTRVQVREKLQKQFHLLYKQHDLIAKLKLMNVPEEAKKTINQLASTNPGSAENNSNA